MTNATAMDFTIDFQPIGTRLVCKSPVLLLDAAMQAGVLLNAVCGGNASCGKCLVQVSGTAVSAVTAAERLILSEAEIAGGYRQACRTFVSGDLTVYVPPASLTAEQKLQVEGTEAEIEIDPVVRKVCIDVSPPTLADPRGDFDRTAAGLHEQADLVVSRAFIPSLAQLSAALRAGSWKVTVALRDGELIGSYSGDTNRTAVGLAVDLGSTKIACYLVDLQTGQTLAAQGVMNPQIGYGEDVVARIEAANRDEGSRLRLSSIVLEAINQLAQDLSVRAGTRLSDIFEVVIVGNTAMHHLLLGLPAQQLGVIPFVPVVAQSIDVRCADLGLTASPGASAYFPPLVAGFVGSDHIAALVASGFGEDGRTRLLVDLGTNTEIALQSGGQILSCSTACGPAFEGAHIRFGMRAAPGAIEHVKIDGSTGQIHLVTVDSRPPVGICGSGILDVVAELLRVGWIDGRGRLGPEGGPSGAPVRSGSGDGYELVLGGESDGGREVVLSQKDLSEVQLAKGAIRAGIDLLMEEAHLRPEQLDEIVLAGAFGAYLDPGNAVRLGLFPPRPLSRIRQVGNAAGVGAKRMLLSRSARQRAAQLAKGIAYVELTLHPRFARGFAEAMRYPQRREALTAANKPSEYRP